jgi:hypothetical protein
MTTPWTIISLSFSFTSAITSGVGVIIAGIGIAFRIPSVDVDGAGTDWKEEAAGMVEMVSNV